MYYKDLAKDEIEVIDIYKKSRKEYSDRAYEEALSKISKILVWLTFKPKLTIKKLNQYVLKEFEDAAKLLPENSKIHETIKYYRDLHENDSVI